MKNQAILVKEENETNLALKFLGQSIGIIALGKKIVLIEGTNSSIDKQVYGSILKDKFPNYVLVPSGGKDVIKSFSTISDKIFGNTIWGIDFFMICDRDTVSKIHSTKELEEKSKGRLKILKRYHIENYFLYEEILAKIFSPMNPKETWLTSADGIHDKLREIARSLISYTVALSISTMLRDKVGNLDVMPKECQSKSEDELLNLFNEKVNNERERILDLIDYQKMCKSIQDEFKIISDSIDKDTLDWKILVPGKPLLNIFANKAQLQTGRLKNLYLNEAEKHEPNPFAEIIEIFESFENLNKK
jgi:hypothetical protein